MPCSSFIERRSNASSERPKSAISVHVRPPHDHAEERDHEQFVRVVAGGSAGAGVFHPSKIRLKSRIVLPPVAVFQGSSDEPCSNGNHAFTQKSRGFLNAIALGEGWISGAVFRLLPTEGTPWQSDMYLSRSPLRRMLNTLMSRQRRPATSPIVEQNLERLQTVFGRNKMREMCSR